MIEFIDEVVTQAETGWGITQARPRSPALTRAHLCLACAQPVLTCAHLRSPALTRAHLELNRAASLTHPNGGGLATDFCYLGNTRQ